MGPKYSALAKPPLTSETRTTNPSTDRTRLPTKNLEEKQVFVNTFGLRVGKRVSRSLTLPPLQLDHCSMDAARLRKRHENSRYKQFCLKLSSPPIILPPQTPNTEASSQPSSAQWGPKPPLPRMSPPALLQGSLRDLAHKDDEQHAETDSQPQIPSPLPPTTPDVCSFEADRDVSAGVARENAVEGVEAAGEAGAIEGTEEEGEGGEIVGFEEETDTAGREEEACGMDSYQDTVDDFFKPVAQAEDIDIRMTPAFSRLDDAERTVIQEEMEVCDVSPTHQPSHAESINKIELEANCGRANAPQRRGTLGGCKRFVFQDMYRPDPAAEDREKNKTNTIFYKKSFIGGANFVNA